MFTRPLRLIFTALSIALVVFCLWPQIFGLSRTNPFAFFVASHGATAAVALISVVVMALLGILGRKVRRFLRPIAVWFMVFAVSSAVLVFQRGWSETVAEKVDGQVVVFTWNTMGAKAGAETIAQLALDSQADVVSLPETTVDMGNAVATIMAKAGTSMSVLHAKFDDVYKAHSTVVLISTALGKYSLATEVGDTTTSPSLVAVPNAPGRPTIVAAHAMAPEPGNLAPWRTDLEWLAKQCSQPNVIIAGDINASIDNVSGLGPAPMGNCGDTAFTLGASAVGTWPTSLPPLIGTQIDHVFYSAEWKPSGFHVITDLPVAVGDHRPVVATLIPVAQ